jgi:hypothetical protein
MITPDRYQLASIIGKADDKIQHGIGWSGYDPNGTPLWLADAILESDWIIAHDLALRRQISEEIAQQALEPLMDDISAYAYVDAARIALGT